MKRPKGKKKEQYLAPGNEEQLEKSASGKEKREGNFTRVTTLSYDEVDPS